jgi:hypothetical protein
VDLANATGPNPNSPWWSANGKFYVPVYDRGLDAQTGMPTDWDYGFNTGNGAWRFPVFDKAQGRMVKVSGGGVDKDGAPMYAWELGSAPGVRSWQAQPEGSFLGDVVSNWFGGPGIPLAGFAAAGGGWGSISNSISGGASAPITTGMAGTMAESAIEASMGMQGAQPWSFSDALKSVLDPTKIANGVAQNAATQLVTKGEISPAGLITGAAGSIVGGAANAAVGGGSLGGVAGAAASAGTQVALGGMLNDNPAPAAPAVRVPQSRGGSGTNEVPTSFGLTLAPFRPQFNRNTAG